jgi:hypothetical protein
MNKAIRIAIAAAFGVAATVPALAGFESYGPGTKQHQELNSLQEVNPPSLDSDPTNALADARSNPRSFGSDRQMFAENRYSAQRSDYYSADGRYHGTAFDDQFRGFPPVLTQQLSMLNGGAWPGQTLE